MKTPPIFLVTLALLSSATPLFAAGFTVDTTLDAVDANPGDGTCADAAGSCTLRAAIQEANALAGADEISLPAGTYKLSIAGASEDAAATGDLDITDDLTITGAGRNVTFVDATPSDTGAVDRVFDASPSSAVTVAMSGLTIQRGNRAEGGGIRNQGILSLTDSRLRWNNSGGTGGGGGLYVKSAVFDQATTLTRTDVDDNTCSTKGGGIAIDFGSVFIHDSNIGFNRASTSGGGIHVNGATGGRLYMYRSTVNTNVAGSAAGVDYSGTSARGVVVNSTIHGNRASGAVGGLRAQGSSAYVANSTISGNSAGTTSGGVQGGSYMPFRNTIIAGNTAGNGTQHDCSFIVSEDYNLVEDTTGCTISGATTNNVTGSDPNLAPLAFYGGLTRISPPLPGSAAVDAGNSGTPGSGGTTCEAEDQHDTPRPNDSACDIGSVETDGFEEPPQPPIGTDFIVTSFADHDGWTGAGGGPGNEVNPGDGVCLGPFGLCTLRGAIIEANALEGPQVIYVPRGHYKDGQAVSGGNGSLYGDLDIGSEITIRGEGSQETVISGDTGDRVFEVLPAGELALKNLMVRRGSSNEGGAIYNRGLGLTLDNVVLRDNFGNGGSGVFTTGDLAVNDSVIRDNRANGSGGGVSATTFGTTITIDNSAFIDNVAAGLGDGGGIIHASSVLTITDTTIAGNRAERGGGIKSTGGGSVALIRSTVSGNVAEYISTPGYGGGIRAFEITITNSTISGNHAKSYSGGVDAYNVILTNTTISDNTAPSNEGISSYNATSVNSIIAGHATADCEIANVMTTLGHNISSDTTCGFTDPDDQENTDPLLGPLADNGGPTKTHALLTGSPAIDAGDDAQAPATDQRGLARPQYSASDIGAFEVEEEPEADLAMDKDNGQTETVAGSSPVYILTVTNNGPEDVTGAEVTDTFDVASFATDSIAWTCAPGDGAGSGTTCPASGGDAELVAGVSVDIEAGDSVVFSVTAPVLSSITGDLSNTASVTHPTIPDPNTDNNDDSDTDTLVRQADLSITKDDGLTDVLPEGTPTYEIVVANAGPSDVSGATVTDTFPTDLTFCSWTCAGSDGGSCTAGPVDGDIDESVDLPAGGSVTFSATCTVDDNATEPIENTATVSAPVGVTALNTDDDSATDTTSVLGPCGFPIVQVLDDSVIDETTTVRACQTIWIGPNLLITSPGDLTATAGLSVVFVDGTSVGTGVPLVIGIDPALALP